MTRSFNQTLKCVSICALAALLLFFVADSPVQAQSASTGGLIGTVSDPSGGVIAGATVTATNLGTGQSRTTTTDANGAYRFSLLPPGNYDVKFSASGFKTADVPSITVDVTETPTLNRALEIDPMTRSAHLYLGILSLQQGDLSRAEKEFEAELALEANNSLALGELGEVRYRQGRWADAVDLIVKSKTTTPSLLYMLCDSYFRLGETQRGDLTAESLAAYGRGEPQVVQALAGLLNRNGQTELAERLGVRAQQP